MDPKTLNLPSCSDQELSALADAVKVEQQQRYQRSVFPQQVATAIESALTSGVPAREVWAVMTEHLPQEETGTPKTYKTTY